MQCAIVIGANYGDEGKGRVVSELFSSHHNERKLNVLTNGGAQRGHTVVKMPKYHKTLSHTFHHFGAGTFDGADTYCGKHFILNPMIFCEEYQKLRDEGLSSNRNFYRHENCMWSTPFDMIANQILEESRGVDRHGSCGVGIWKTIQRYQNGVHMKFNDFIRIPHESQVKFLHEVRDYYVNRGMCDNKEISNRYPIFSDTLIEHFINDCKYMSLLSTQVKSNEESWLMNYYDYIVFENGQGLLLNDDVNNVHTTPSNTSCEQVHSMIERTIKGALVDVVYVSRPYITRHGNGVISNECSKNELSNIINEKTNVTNQFQGEFRYATLNLQELFQRVEKSFEQTRNGISKNLYTCRIAFTHMDEIESEDSHINSDEIILNSLDRVDSTISGFLLISNESSGGVVY